MRIMYESLHEGVVYINASAFNLQCVLQVILNFFPWSKRLLGETDNYFTLILISFDTLRLLFYIKMQKEKMLALWSLSNET